MKIRIGLAALVAAGALSAFNSQADDLFQLFWRVNLYQKGGDGRITVTRLTEQDLVAPIAQNNNLNPGDCVLVYRPNKHDTAVVLRANGKFVADVIQMEYNYTDIVNPSGQTIVRHALLYDESHTVPLGSFFGVENRQANPAGGVSSDSLYGTVMYAKPDLGQTFAGQISTGARVRDTSGG